MTKWHILSTAIDKIYTTFFFVFFLFSPKNNLVTIGVWDK